MGIQIKNYKKTQKERKLSKNKTYKFYSLKVSFLFASFYNFLFVFANYVLSVFFSFPFLYILIYSYLVFLLIVFSPQLIILVANQIQSFDFLPTLKHELSRLICSTFLFFIQFEKRIAY